MGDIQLVITVRNGRLLRAMQAAGFDTAAALSRASGISNSYIGQLLALKAVPTAMDGSWRRPVQRIAETLKCLPEDLFPPAFVRRCLGTNRVERDMTEEQFIALAGPSRPSIAYDPERAAIVGEALRAVDDALAGLPAKERVVLERRFALSGREPETLEAIADALGVTRERIRQIELRALRRLRGPSRVAALSSAMAVVAQESTE